MIFGWITSCSGSSALFIGPVSACRPSCGYLASLIVTRKASLTAGLGCIQVGAAVKCDNVSRIKFIGGAGDDTFRNDSGLPVQLEGGPGRDRLSGGPANDAIIGGADSDFAFGGPGTDTCSQSENESGCEL
jgi:hypothetical protein